MSEPIYKHVEGTDYTCPKCFVKAGEGTLRTVLHHHRRDVFCCPNCQGQFSARYLEGLSLNNEDIPHFPFVGHMWKGTAHEEKLVDAIEDFWRLSK